MVKAKKTIEKKEKEFKLEDIFNFSIAGDAKPSMQKQKPYYTSLLCLLAGSRNAKFLKDML